MITKGGTNQLHGALSEYNNNSASASHGLLRELHRRRQAASPRPTSGPRRSVVRRLFPRFTTARTGCFSFSPMKAYSPAGLLRFLARRPTAAERQGDFSHLLSLNNSDQELYALRPEYRRSFGKHHHAHSVSEQYHSAEPLESDRTELYEFVHALAQSGPASTTTPITTAPTKIAQNPVPLLLRTRGCQHQ